MQQGVEVVEVTLTTTSSTTVEAASDTAIALELILRSVCDQGAIEVEAEKILRKCGSHLASHKTADDTGLSYNLKVSSIFVAISSFSFLMFLLSVFSLYSDVYFTRY